MEFSTNSLRGFEGGLQLRPLKFIDYNSDRSLADLNDYCGFEYYGGNHLENTLTYFIRQCWLYKNTALTKESLIYQV